MDIGQVQVSTFKFRFKGKPRSRLFVYLLYIYSPKKPSRGKPGGMFTVCLHIDSIHKNVEVSLISNCSYNKATMLLPDARSSAVFVGTFVVAYVVWKFVRDTRTRATRRRPRSLWSLPLIGSILFLPVFRIWHKEFLKMSGKIGNVFAFYMGSQYVLCSVDASRQCVT